MATRQRRPTSGHKAISRRRRPESNSAKGSGDRNQARREQYASDPGHRDKLKRESRREYRSKTAPANPPAAALQTPGVEKEVFVEGMDHPMTAEVYTIPEAAKALGKSVITLKRWIGDDLIPPPVLTDAVHGYKHYSKGELSIICELLHEYANDYSYIVSSNNSFVHSVWQKLEHYRRTKI